MATGLKSRIAYKTPSSSVTSGDYWAGTYKLLLRAKSIPSPFGSQNMVDTSTLEDLVETQEKGKNVIVFEFYIEAGHLSAIVGGILFFSYLSERTFS